LRERKREGAKEREIEGTEEERERKRDIELFRQGSKDHVSNEYF
jgi:hypothetical protein